MPKFLLVVLLFFLNYALYCHGMENVEQLRNKPRVLRAEADPFIPQSRRAQQDQLPNKPLSAEAEEFVPADAARVAKESNSPESYGSAIDEHLTMIRQAKADAPFSATDQSRFTDDHPLHGSSSADLVRSSDKGKGALAIAGSNRFAVLQREEENENVQEEGDSAAVQFTPTPVDAAAMSLKHSSTFSSSSSSSKISKQKSKGKKAVVYYDDGEMTEKEIEDISNFIVNTVIYSVLELEKKKEECKKMKAVNKRDKQMRVREVFKLLTEYRKILKILNTFCATYYRGDYTFVYIGDMFKWMVKYTAVMDHERLTNIIRETLFYLDEILSKYQTDFVDFDVFYNDMTVLKRTLDIYDRLEEKDKDRGRTKIIETYKEKVEGKIATVLSYLFIGHYYPLSKANLLTNDMIYKGFVEFEMLFPNREDIFRAARLMVGRYYREIVQDSEEKQQQQQKKTEKNDPVIEQIREEDKNTLEYFRKKNDEIEYIIRRIEVLELEHTKYLAMVSEPGERMNQKNKLKFYFHSILMGLLTKFVQDYKELGEKCEYTLHSDFWGDTITWMVKFETGSLFNEEQKEAIPIKLNETMQTALNFIQEVNEGEKDVTNFSVLFEEIALLENKISQLKNSEVDGYENPVKREALQNLRDLYQRRVVPKLREAIGFVFIGMKAKSADELLTKTKVVKGLTALSVKALPQYKQQFENSIVVMEHFYVFLNDASVQEIRENLTEFLAKMLGIDISNSQSEDGIVTNVDKLADKINYPPILMRGLAAIKELKNQKGKMKTVPDEKQKHVDKTAVSPSNTFGPVNKSNWVEVLEEASRLIRFVYILVQIQEAEEKPEKIFDRQTVYLRVWTILYQDQFLPVLNKWETIYRMMLENKDPKKKQKTNMSPIIKFYSDGIFEFAKNLNKANHVRRENEAKGKKIRQALERVSELYYVQFDMFPRSEHLRIWVGEKLVKAGEKKFIKKGKNDDKYLGLIDEIV